MWFFFNSIDHYYKHGWTLMSCATQIYISVTQFTFQVTCTAVDDIEVASTDKGEPWGTVIESKTVTVEIVIQESCQNCILIHVHVFTQNPGSVYGNYLLYIFISNIISTMHCVSYVNQN